MENTNITNTSITSKEVAKKVAAAILENSEIITTINTIVGDVNRYNCIKSGDPMTDDEVKAGGLDTITNRMDIALEQLNHGLKKATYEALYSIRQDALPAIILGCVKQYTIKSVASEDDATVILLAFEEKPQVLSIKNYNAWAKKTHKATIVADESYFTKADTIAYYLLCGIADELGISISNYRFTYGLDQSISKGAFIGTKASNTKMLGEIQKCLDALLMVPRDDGKNNYRCISKDITYLRNVVVSAGKNRLELKAMKSTTFLAKVEDVMFRIITNREYSLSYAQAKNK